MRRLRVKPDLSFGDRLAKEAARLRDEASHLPMGKERAELLRKARQADTASHINEWLSSWAAGPNLSIALD